MQDSTSSSKSFFLSLKNCKHANLHRQVKGYITMNTEMKELLEECLNKLGYDKLKDELNRVLSLHNGEEVLTIIVNEGVHPHASVHDRGEVYIASRGNLDFSSKETSEEEFKKVLTGVASKLKSKIWKKIYLVPFGPSVLAMQIKLLVYRISHIETIDVLHAGNGVYYDLEINQRDIAISSDIAPRI